jgi:hypothetical protein
VQATVRVTVEVDFVWELRPSLTGAAVLLTPYPHHWLRRHRRADALKLKTMLEADDG